MVDTVNHTGLSLSQLDGVATSSRETYENQKAKPLQRSRWKVGWVSRNKSRLRSRQNFFLDIPLYRWDEKVDPRSRMALSYR